MNKYLVWFLALTFGGLIACDQKPKPQAPETPASTEVPASAQPVQVDPDTVMGLLENWRDFQNENKLPLYIGMYSSQFLGVVPDAERTRRYDFSGWEKKRERDNEPSNLRLTDIQIATAFDSAVATFKATRGDDVTSKQLVFAKVDGELLILREEIIPKPDLSDALPPSQIAHVIDGQYVVLPAEVKADWQRGNPLPNQGVDGTTGVEMSKVPVEFRRWVGRQVRMYDEGGSEICATKVISLRIIARLMPPSATAAAWSAAEANAVAEQAFGLAGLRGGLLVAKTDERCEGAVVANARTEAPTFFETFVPSSAEEGMVLSQFYETDFFQSIEKEGGGPGNRGPWVASPPDLQFRGFFTEKKRVVTLSVRAGTGCGDFFVRASAMFEVFDERALILGRPFQTHFVPVVVLDSDDDGSPEFVSKDQIFAKGPRGWKVMNDAQIPNYDSPCK